MDNEAESREGIISEIERYMANPGQALSYKVGQLKLQHLRAKANKQLGDRFDIREFHEVILAEGTVTLSILESRINSYIEKHKNE